MELREALIQQSPSLALQRAAADEIARLDGEVSLLNASLEELQQLIRTQHDLIKELKQCPR